MTSSHILLLLCFREALTCLYSSLDGYLASLKVGMMYSLQVCPSLPVSFHVHRASELIANECTASVHRIHSKTHD